MFSEEVVCNLTYPWATEIRRNAGLLSEDSSPPNHMMFGAVVATWLVEIVRIGFLRRAVLLERGFSVWDFPNAKLRNRPSYRRLLR